MIQNREKLSATNKQTNSNFINIDEKPGCIWAYALFEHLQKRPVCGLGCAELNILSESSHLIAIDRHSAV